MSVIYPIQLVDVPTAWRGDPFTWKLLLLQADGATPQDLTAYGTTWAASARTSIDASTSVDFAVALALTSGYVTLSLTGAQTAAMRRETYGFDVQASGGTTSPFTLWVGALNVDGEWTHA